VPASLKTTQRLVVLGLVFAACWLVSLLLFGHGFPHATDLVFIGLAILAGSAVVGTAASILGARRFATVIVYVSLTLLVAKWGLPAERQHYVKFLFGLQTIVLGIVLAAEVWLVVTMFLRIYRSFGARSTHEADAMQALGPLAGEPLMREIYVREFGIWYFLLRSSVVLAEIYRPLRMHPLRAVPFERTFGVGLVGIAVLCLAGTLARHWGWAVPLLLSLYAALYAFADHRSRSFIGTTVELDELRVRDGLLRTVTLPLDGLVARRIDPAEAIALSFTGRLSCMPPLAQPNVYLAHGTRVLRLSMRSPDAFFEDLRMLRGCSQASHAEEPALV
jgi:hypothetical protein